MNTLQFFIVAVLISVAICASTCGQTPVKPTIDKSEEKIVGGHFATPYSWPWQVVFCTAGWFSTCSLECGGTIIAPGFVMTAGHCVYGSTNAPKTFRVKTGVFDEATQNENGEVIHRIKAIHLHPKYIPDPDPVWDIAILELEDTITFNDHVQPVCLPTHDSDVVVDPNSAWVTGWGTTTENGNISKKLRQVKVPFVNATQCDSEYPHELQDNVMICAGKRGIDTCQGDSGGPLVVQSKSGAWFQYGITSFGSGCAEYRHPGIYSRVTAYCDFIKTTTNGNVTCTDPSN
uniref:Peptidase S1 domain-containing protein n=1 Tax=Rhabditophanes sp. KR3021 TaxID=114890 RepID=A0AC35THB9_9BILA